jgi:acyl-coenzyme A synthetase/AMP-(fatty) acid ligase
MDAPLIHRRFDGIAREARGRVALRTPAGETTFGELLDRSDRFAGALAARGCGPGDRVAIESRDHAAIVAALLGCWKAGCVAAPIDLGRRERQLAALRCRATASELTGAGEPALREHAADPEAACSIYFTSGSTGAPRAIVGRLAGIDHHIGWELAFLDAGPATRGAIIHAPTYDAHLPDALVPLCAGGVACAPPPGLDPARLCAWLADEAITLLHCVPSLFRALVACRPRLPALAHVLLAGEAVRPADVRDARAVLGDRVRLVNLYGPTEATLVKLHHAIADTDDPVPIGTPMPGVTVHLLDAERRPVPAGELGEIAIQSRFGSHGYLDEPELTRARFVPAPDGSGEPMYLTGDYGSRLPGGALAFHGRRDRQIKLCGARVDLDEVEAILGSCDGVVEAAVIADDSVLRGFVVLAAATPIARVRAQAGERLAPAMRLAWLTELDALPRTASGKLDRHRIAGGAS